MSNDFAAIKTSGDVVYSPHYWFQEVIKFKFLRIAGETENFRSAINEDGISNNSLNFLQFARSLLRRWCQELFFYCCCFQAWCANQSSSRALILVLH